MDFRRVKSYVPGPNKNISAEKKKSLLQDIFRDPFYKGPNLRNRVHFIKPNIKTQKYGERSL